MTTYALGRIAGASQAVVRSRQESLVRSLPERRRRQLVRLIDLAIDGCEQVNLEGAPDARGQRPPPSVSAPAIAAVLVEWLQEAAGEPRRPPATNQEALEELFRLQEAYLLGAPSDGEGAKGEAS